MVAPTASTVLVCGESGTGKELVANAIHENSPRKDGPYVRVNIAALPEGLIESELFGHEKGAFTGAAALKKGRFELAHGGTIFLDEIGDLAPHLQVKLLRVIQEKSIERLGGEKTLPLDVRIVAATHRDLEEKIVRGEFREDLYYRLNVFPLYVPPLRERKADVILLADHFLERYSREHGKTIGRISSEAIDMLAAYHWPGNVRELENCMERAVIMSGEDVIRSYHLPPSLQMARPAAAPVTLEEMVNGFRREIIIDHLKMSRGNITSAAEMLGTTKRILTYTIHNLGIEYARYR
jgi:Nif-specific regulatory protein